MREIDMYALGYVRMGGFGWTSFGEDEASCQSDGKHYDPNTDSCFDCGAGTYYDAATNSCPDIVSPGGGPSPAPSPGGGGGTVPSGPGGGPTKASVSSTAKGALPWLIGGAALLGIIYFAGKKKHH